MKLRIDIHTNRQYYRAKLLEAFLASVAIVKMKDGTLYDGVFIRHIDTVNDTVEFMSVHDYSKVRVAIQDISHIDVH